MTKEKEQKSRKNWRTKITSASLSETFAKYVEDYDISPTEAMRKGIALELYERGVEQFNSETNRERSEAIKRFLESEDYKEKLKQIKIFAEGLISDIKELEGKDD